MGGLRQSSRVLNNLSSLHIVYGSITVTSNVWTLTCNDATATLTDIGGGNVSVDFGENFIAAPAVSLGVLKATHEAAVVKTVLVEQATTALVEFRCHSIDDSGAGATDITAPDPDDGDGWCFVIIGHRNH